VGQMSGRRRPRHPREDPWVVWGCCGGPLLACVVVLLVFIIAFWTWILGGGLDSGPLLCGTQTLWVTPGDYSPECVEGFFSEVEHSPGPMRQGFLCTDYGEV
jgi:hypothetical protein